MKLHLVLSSVLLGISSATFAISSSDGKGPEPMVSAAAPPAMNRPPPQIPLKDFFKNPQVTGFRLSPDGKRVLLLRPWEGRFNIFIRDLAGGEETRITEVKDRDLRSGFWKGNRYIIYSRDFGGDENFHLYSYDLKTKVTRDLVPYENTRVGVVDSLEDVDDNHMLISHNHRNAKVFDVFRLDLRTGKTSLVAQNDGSIDSWMTDHLGRLRLAIQSVGTETVVLYRATEGQKFKEILRHNYRDSFSPEFFTFDNKNIYVVSNIGRDKSSLVVFDPKAKNEVSIVYQNPGYDVLGASYSKKRKVLTASFYEDAKAQIAFLDPSAEKTYNSIEDKLPGARVVVVSRNKNEDVFVVRTVSDRSLGAFYLYEKNTDKLTKLEEVSPWINPELMAPMEPFVYTSRDGLKIEGYLTLPLGRAPRNLPVVVIPHGGPWARDGWGFDSEAQFLANRGYGVLQMNFRGSTGFGKKHFEASFKQWGLKMQDDITDGVQWLIRQGIANDNKVCIYGGSYGGYAALSGLAFTPDLYACGISYVGVSNLFTFQATIPPYWELFREKLQVFVGDPEKDKDQLTATSPALNADKIKAPLFVAQGANDPRVKKAESDQMVEALRRRGVKVEYMLKDNEGHGFHNEENRMDFYQAMESFLGKYLN